MTLTLNQGGGNFSEILQNLELLISNCRRNEFLPPEKLHLVYPTISELVRCIPAEVAQDAQCCIESDSLIKSVNMTKSAETAADGDVEKDFTPTSLGAQVMQPELPALPSFDHST